jgi:adenosine deaminase
LEEHAWIEVRRSSGQFVSAVWKKYGKEIFCAASLAKSSKKNKREYPLSSSDTISKPEIKFGYFLYNLKALSGYLDHPYLMEILKKRKIAIEANPVSNQMLGYVPDQRHHPAITYLRYGMPVVLGADDPATLGYNEFTLASFGNILCTDGVKF